MPQRDRRVAACYYGGVGLLLLLTITHALGHLLPAGVAKKVGADSEGYLLALALPAWVQFVRPRVPARVEWAVTLLVAVAALAIGVVLYRTTSIKPSVKTLNETFIALAFLVPYVQLRRPLPRGLAVGTAALVLGLTFLGDQLPLVNRLAETLGMLLLVPLAVDVVDRGILEPRVVVSPRLRWAWYALLLLAPLGIAVLHRAGLGGFPADVVSYWARAQEAFVGVLLLELFLAVGLGRTGQRLGSRGPAGQVTGPRVADRADR